MSLFDSIAGRVKSNVSSRVPSLASIGQSLGGALIGKFAPKGMAGALSRAMRGDIVGAVADGVTGFVSGKIAKALGKNPLLGGITLEEASRISDEIQATNYARKNLWLLQVVDWNPPSGYEDITHKFNLFASDVSYTGWNIGSEAQAIGMTVIDKVNGSERVEMRITTCDDTKGTIKGWFDAKCAMVAHQDGTVGLPAEYLVSITIIHSATDEIGGALFGQYKEKFAMRPSSIEIELSRSENGLQQLQMVFTQFDTFM